MDKLKVGIIGSGFIAEHHCCSYSQLLYAEIVGISSLNTEEVNKLMKKYSIQCNFYKNYENLIKSD